ncbi:MAG: hypothetical protein ACE5IJ_11110 [Thermoplasmata archaeon]
MTRLGTGFVYPDTNILSELAKNRRLWDRLRSFLTDSGLALGINHQISELTEAPFLHEDLADLLLQMPSGFIKRWDSILDEEVAAHPRRRSNPLLLHDLSDIRRAAAGKQQLIDLLRGRQLRAAREHQKSLARQVPHRHGDLKANFPPSRSGRYIREQAAEFADAQVMQWLAGEHRDFLQQFGNNIEGFHPEVFESVRLFAYVVFYKYYLQGRDPSSVSEFADLGHLAPQPYCELVITERDLCDVLKQIKRNEPILEATEIRSIEFLENWDWSYE